LPGCFGHAQLEWALGIGYVTEGIDASFFVIDNAIRDQKHTTLLFTRGTAVV
jgi:hypothetical protein